MSRYESHAGLMSAEKTFIFHLDRIAAHGSLFVGHWHENIELLFVIEGSIDVMTNHVTVTAGTGQLAVVNSNHLHIITAERPAQYYCLIVDKGFLESYGIFVEETEFQRLVDNLEAGRLFRRIIQELEQKKEHYLTQVKGNILSLLVLLSRNCVIHSEGLTDPATGRKLEAVKQVLRYLQRHYREEVSLQSVAEAVGFNKYYISHLFKEFVGCSVVQYIQKLRCSHAKSLLEAGHMVSEAAELSGFENLSYFTRTYKKHMQALPRTHQRTLKNGLTV